MAGANVKYFMSRTKRSRKRTGSNLRTFHFDEQVFLPRLLYILPPRKTTTAIILLSFI
jgi:hypothetical protein